MEYQLVWHGPAGSPELEAIVVEDLKKWCDVKHASALILHVVMLDHAARNCPSVKVWGVKGDHRFHCEYHNHNVAPSFHIDDIPGFRDKLKKAGWKDPDESDA